MAGAPQNAVNSFVLEILPLSCSISKIFLGTSRKPMTAIRELAIFLALILFPASFAFAQAQRGTLVKGETIRVSPSADSPKLGHGEVDHELAIIDSERDCAHVEAILRESSKDGDEEEPEAEGKTITGW